MCIIPTRLRSWKGPGSAATELVNHISNEKRRNKDKPIRSNDNFVKIERGLSEQELARRKFKALFRGIEETEAAEGNNK